MSYHILITANDEQRTVVYDKDVEDFDLHDGVPVVITVGRSAAFSGEGTLDAEVSEAKPAKKRRWRR